MELVGLPPVSREQAFLETYFQCISKFAFDKAKELSVRVLHLHCHSYNFLKSSAIKIYF